jgi:hypothetical protein
LQKAKAKKANKAFMFEDKKSQPRMPECIKSQEDKDLKIRECHVMARYEQTVKFITSVKRTSKPVRQCGASRAITKAVKHQRSQ